MSKELDEALYVVETGGKPIPDFPFRWKEVSEVITRAYRFSQALLRAQGEEIAGLKDERTDLLAQRPVWRCFHCGEVFKQHQAASDHFSIEGIPPMCVDPLTKDEKARMVVVRKLEAELTKWRNENEQLDHEAGAYHAMQAELGRYFGTCAGFPVKTAHQAFLVYEAMIGAKEAAESQVAALTASRAALEKDLGRAREAANNWLRMWEKDTKDQAHYDEQHAAFNDMVDVLRSLPQPAPVAKPSSPESERGEACSECGGEEGKFVMRHLGGHPDWVPCKCATPSEPGVSEALSQDEGGRGA